MKTIVAKIDKYVRANAGKKTYRRWYVGIASDVEERLFNDHKVDRQNTGDWLYYKAKSCKAARRAEKRLHRLGFKGDSGGGHDGTDKVYAYKITSTTVQ